MWLSVLVLLLTAPVYACDVDEETGNFVARNEKTPHCAGALIFLEKRNKPHPMMRICERIGLYDRTKLNMKAPVQ